MDAPVAALGPGRQRAAHHLGALEIAERLVIETATVKRHVGSLLTKLDLKSRAQLIVFAFQHGHITVGDL